MHISPLFSFVFFFFSSLTFSLNFAFRSFATAIIESYFFLVVVCNEYSIKLASKTHRSEWIREGKEKTCKRGKHRNAAFLMMMRPRLETGSLVSQRSTRLIHCPPALRRTRTLDHKVTQPFSPSRLLALQRVLRPSSADTNVDATPARYGHDAFPAASRRPRAAGATRLFKTPRFLSCQGSSEGITVANRDRCMASKSSGAPSSSTYATSLGTRLRRNHVVAACPLLYSTTLSMYVADGLAKQGRQSCAAVTREFEALAGDMQSVWRTGGAACAAIAEVGGSWSCFSSPYVATLCGALHRHSSLSLSVPVFVQCLCQFVATLSASADAELERCVKAMVQSLLAYWTAQRGVMAPSTSHVESTVRTLLESTPDVLVPALLEAFQVSVSHPSTAPLVDAPLRYGSHAADSFHGAQRWHPCLSEAAVKACLQRVAQVSSSSGSGGEKHRGGAEPAGLLTPALRDRLHRCCACQLPPLTDDRVRHDCAVLTMNALKGAAFPVLVAAYEYLVEEGLASVPVALRFLTNCGMCVPHVTQRGVSLTVYLAARAASAESLPSTRTDACFVVPRTTLAPLLHARQTLLDSGRELKQIEGGLVHVSAVLNALGYAADVRAFYACQHSSQTSQLPSTALAELRETPHSVMACVRLRRVGAAVTALAELGASRPEGWVFVPPAVVQCMEAVSRLVGAAGTPAQVDALYIALIDFHNGALFTSHYIELVLAGVCDRIRDLRSQERRGEQPQQTPAQDKRRSTAAVLSKATPHEMLDSVIPVVRATLRYVGDELNADMILELVETALHVDDYAVPLTAALIRAFRAWMDLSLCLQELLCRVDASTHNVPFLHFYALCYARDFCRPAVFDHLAALWHVNGDSVWHRAAHLSPSCQLWKCAACGRLNSDRYNYCLCSALRYSYVLCGTCGYAQDERLRQCLSCGTALLSAAALSGAIARKAWQCGDCGARNPAKQTLLCFRCGAPTGPRFSTAACAQTSSAASLKNFCDCHAVTEDTATNCKRSSAARQKHRDGVYAAAVGVCRSCGRFKMDYAAHHSAVWVCAGCHRRRSTLERLCPSCPQVECLPHAVCRQEPIEVPRQCRHCRHEELNPFTVVCSACGSGNDPFRKREEAAPSSVGGSSSSSTAAAATSAAGHECGRSAEVSHWCFHCQHVQPWKDGAALLLTCCDSCGAPCEARGRCALVPPRACGQCGAILPSPYGGSAVCPSCAAYVEPAPQPQESCAGAASSARPPASPWNAVTVLHTCEVLDACCAREARLAVSGAESGAATSDLSATSPTVSPAESGTASFIQRRPTIEKTLTRLLHEWTDDNSADALTTLGAAAWLPMRMDVAMVLGRALNRLRQCVPFSLTARRLSALIKGILAHVDALCGMAATGCRDSTVGHYNVDTHFTAEEVCHHCLGTHPEELCPFREDGGSWTCETCGTANNNDDVGRYVCAGCLALRPLVQDALVSTCWTCRGCHRANMQFERYCMHCGLERPNWSPSLLLPPLLPHHESGDRADEERTGETNVDFHLSTVSRDDEVPFTPAKCHLCGLVYIEARCPLCENHIPDVADAQGTVCEVHAHHAFIQPVGTTRPQDRIYVGESLLLANTLREGLEVHYTAELGTRGRMQATHLRC